MSLGDKSALLNDIPSRLKAALLGGVIVCQGAAAVAVLPFVKNKKVEPSFSAAYSGSAGAKRPVANDNESILTPPTIATAPSTTPTTARAPSTTVPVVKTKAAAGYVPRQGDPRYKPLRTTGLYEPGRLGAFVQCIRDGESWGGKRDAVSINPPGLYRGPDQFLPATWDSIARASAPHLVGVDPAKALAEDQDYQVRRLIESIKENKAAFVGQYPRRGSCFDAWMAGTVRAVSTHIMETNNHGQGFPETPFAPIALDPTCDLCL